MKQAPELAFHKNNSFSGQPLIHKIFLTWRSSANTFTRETLLGDKTLSAQWDKLVITLRAALKHTSGEDHARTPQLHLALLFSACPVPIVHRFVQVYSQQASTRIRNPYDTHDSACNACPRHPTWSRSNRTLPLHAFLLTKSMKKGSSSVLRSLLKAYPQALNMEDDDGLYPLHLAIASGVEWDAGLKEIVYGAPHILEYRHRSSGLLPFMQAALLNNTRTAYCLLRENPALTEPPTKF